MEVDVLITVKAYPTASAKYLETVCTAGIGARLGFVRLYPIRFRALPYGKQYRKYETIRAELVRNAKDPRPESYRLAEGTMQVVSGPIGTEDDWRERRELVLPHLSASMEDLWARQKEVGTCLGLVRPSDVTDVTVTRAESTDWTPRQREAIEQFSLFGEDLKPIPKLPVDFRYRFRCDDPRCRGHELKIIDWELGALYWKVLARREGDERAAAADVRAKFLDELCSPERDTCFFVGNMQRYPTSWLVLGVFWPPKQAQQELTF